MAFYAPVPQRSEFGFQPQQPMPDDVLGKTLAFLSNIMNATGADALIGGPMGFVGKNALGAAHFTDRMKRLQQPLSRAEQDGRLSTEASRFQQGGNYMPMTDEFRMPTMEGAPPQGVMDAVAEKTAAFHRWYRDKLMKDHLDDSFGRK